MHPTESESGIPRRIWLAGLQTWGIACAQTMSAYIRIQLVQQIFLNSRLRILIMGRRKHSVMKTLRIPRSFGGMGLSVNFMYDRELTMDLKGIILEPSYQ